MFKKFKERKGAVAVMAAIVTTALLGFTACAVDIGMVITSRNQLQNAVDSAALSAASKLDSNILNGTTIMDTAETYARYNKVLNQPVALQKEDGDIQIFDNPDKALRRVKVTAYRTRSRGNPISLQFAKVLGYSSVDMTASSKAGLIPVSGTNGIRPWAIRDRCLSTENDNQNQNDNQNGNENNNENANQNGNGNENENQNENDNGNDNENDNQNDNENDNGNGNDNENQNNNQNQNNNSNQNNNQNGNENNNGNSNQNGNGNSNSNQNNNQNDNENGNENNNENNNENENENEDENDNGNANQNDNENENGNDNENNNQNGNENDNGNANENGNDNDNENSNEEATPCTSYEYPVVGELVTMKFGPQNNEVEPYWFGPVCMPPANKGTPQTGANAYRDLIENGYNGMVEIGDALRVEPGNMAGPTYQGVNYLISQDPTAYWDGGTNQVMGSSYPNNQSPRIIKIVFYDPNIGIVGNPGEITVTRIGAFFLEGAMDAPNSSVSGRFIENVSSGTLDVNSQSRVFGIGLTE